MTDAVPIVISFAQWRLSNSGVTPVLLIGSDHNGLQPWNVVAGNLRDLSIPDGVNSHILRQTTPRGPP